MPPQSFNDRQSPNGPVSGGGDTAKAPSTPSGSNRIPSTVQQSDGVDGLRSNPQTIRTGTVPSTPSGKAGPTLPQHFNDTVK